MDHEVFQKSKVFISNIRKAAPDQANEISSLNPAPKRDEGDKRSFMGIPETVSLQNKGGILSQPANRGFISNRLNNIEANRLNHIEESRSTTTTQTTQIDRKNFKIIKVLGKGAFGEVYHVEKIDTGEEFAMKKLNKIRMTS